MRTRVAVLAGNGRLPVCFAAEAVQAGLEVVAIGLTPDIDEELEQYVTELHRLSIGCWQAVLDVLHEAKARDIYLLGKVEKGALFSNIAVDSRFGSIVGPLLRRNDDRIILAFVEDLQREGFAIHEQRALLPSLFPGVGVLSHRAPTEREWHDIAFGYEMALGIAGLDIGQTCVVQGGAVLAVEAIEGTDLCIRRGGGLGSGEAVVVKVAKPSQDPRFDVPTVGPGTLAVMLEAGARALAFEAGATFMVDRTELLSLADAHDIAVVGYRPGSCEG